MYLAVFTDPANEGQFVGNTLNEIHEQYYAEGWVAEDLTFYKCEKINVREIPARLELVKEEPVRKPAVKSKK